MTTDDHSHTADDWIRAHARRSGAVKPEPGESFDEAIRRAAGRTREPLEPLEPKTPEEKA